VSGGPVTADDLRFINLVATRTFGPGGTPPEPDRLDATLAAVPEGPPNKRAAALAGALLAGRLFTSAPLVTAFLSMSCQLELGGTQLLAPQGAIVGMVRELADAGVDVGTVERWLQDRAVPASAEG